MGTDSRSILIIGGRVETVRKARDLGLRVVNIQRPEEYRPEHAALVEGALLAEYTDWAVLGPLVTAAHQVYGFSGVATITEPGVEPAGLIADALGIRGNSHRCARLMRDKEEMRRHLAGRPDAVAAEPVTDRDSLAAFGRRHGYPFIVKPVDAAASFGVRLVEGPEAVADAWACVEALRGSTAHRFANYFPVGRFLMEEYLDGPEYSVESLSFDGRHIPLAVTEKTTHANFVESGHAMPARLAPAEEAAVLRCARELLDAVGLRHGPAHTEVKLTGRGPRVIESHGRPGGDRIMDLVEAAYGVDIEAYTVGWAAGALPALDSAPQARAAAATCFLTADPGRVVSVGGSAAALAHEGVIGVDLAVAVGDTIRPLEASWDRVGQVLATAPDTGAAVALSERVAAEISVVTEPIDPIDPIGPNEPNESHEPIGAPRRAAMAEHVLVFGNGYDIPGRLRALGAATGRPITTSVLCRPEHLAKLEAAAEHSRIVAVRADAPTEEWVALARAVHAVAPVTRIGTFGDQCQPEAAAAGRALGVPTHDPETVRLVFDKFAMRQRLAGAGVDPTPAAEVRDLAALHAFGTEHGYPCVVKPRQGTASSGVSVVRSADLAEAAFLRAGGAEAPAGVVVEAFLTGDQYSVECFSEQGDHAVVAITRKYSDPVSLVELGHVMPAPLEPADAERIRALVCAALTALRVEFGPTHTEVVLTGSGPRIIETHLRVGGDELWNMVTDATGVDLVEYQLRQCAGEEVLPDVRDLLAKGPVRHEAVWFAGAPAAGRLVEVAGAGDPQPEGVALEVLGTPGQQLDGLQSSDSRLAQARAHADTAEQALTLAREAIGRLEFVTRISAEQAELL